MTCEHTEQAHPCAREAVIASDMLPNAPVFEGVHFSTNDPARLAPMFEDLSRAQAAFEVAKKDADNPYHKSKYADLAEVIRSMRQPLADNGFSVLQPVTGTDPELITVHTILTHRSGETIQSSWTVRPMKNKKKKSWGNNNQEDEDDPGIPGIQDRGTWISYLRRYGLQSFLCLAADDDDGNSADGLDQANKANAAQKPRGGFKAPAPAKNTDMPPRAQQRAPQPPSAAPQQEERRVVPDQDKLDDLVVRLSGPDYSSWTPKKKIREALCELYPGDPSGSTYSEEGGQLLKQLTMFGQGASAKFCRDTEQLTDKWAFNAWRELTNMSRER